LDIHEPLSVDSGYLTGNKKTPIVAPMDGNKDAGEISRWFGESSGFRFLGTILSRLRTDESCRKWKCAMAILLRYLKRSVKTIIMFVIIMLHHCMA
jgi:hypothetical protein